MESVTKKILILLIRSLRLIHQMSLLLWFIAVVFCLLSVATADECVNDAASLLEVAKIIESKSVADVTRGDGTTTIRYFPTSESASSLADWRMSSRFFSILAVIDISEFLAVDPTYKLTIKDLKSFEKETSMKIKEGSVLLLRSNHTDKTFNGWDGEVLEYIFETREATAVGHDQIAITLPADQEPLFEGKALIESCGTLPVSAKFNGLIQLLSNKTAPTDSNNTA